ncbi:MAG: ATP-binding cassette domain-containing protein [Myxococcales bacterium]|nr:ATP-binding cassette domain-containing protein [Myxococcales bacterium]
MTAHVRAQQLAYVYPGGFGVGPLQLELGPGVHHLQGANGSGKTTLMRCLCADLRRSTGTLGICGSDPRTEVEGRRQVAWMAAEPQLPDFLTVREAWQQLAVIRGSTDWDGSDLCRQLDLPEQLLLGHCSAGQRRMAELVAACVGSPAVMLLDEPFANLDAGRVRTLCALIEAWRTDRVLVITSHEPLPMEADSVVTLP